MRRWFMVWLWVWLGLGSAQGAVVTADFAQDAGTTTWTVDLAVTNDGAPEEISAFTVYFDAARYGDLAVDASPDGWDSLVLDSDPMLPADGFFDSLLDAALTPLQDGQTQGGFRISFTLLQGDAPAPLPFEIYAIDEDGSLAILFEGTTTTPGPSTVPEPSSVALTVLALLAGWVGARVRRRRAPVRPSGLAALSLLGAAACLPVAAVAAEVKGVVMVSVVGAELLPGRYSSPLKDVQLFVGTLERVSPGYPYRESFFAPLAVTTTDDEGKYRVDLGNYPPTEIVVVLLLRSDDGAVSVYDHQMDPDRPACLGSRVIPVNQSGTTQADLLLAVNPDNSSVYEFGSYIFEPTRDSEAPPVYGRQPRCAVDALGKPGQLAIPSPAYDGAGMTNTQPDRFAHLAAHYVRAYDAYEFVRDGLGKSSFTPVRVAGWYDDTMSYRYSCEDSTILLGRPSSPLANWRSTSRIFAMRHEYGHHFMCATEMAGGAGRLPARAAEDSHDGLLNSDSADAWTEGFATYFAAAVAEHKGEARPHVQRTAAGELDLQADRAAVDDPFAAGEQFNYGTLGEEFAIAAVLWDLSRPLGSKLLLETLEQDSLDLVDFNRTYMELWIDPEVRGALSSAPACDFPATGASKSGVDCYFIWGGFYHDLNGDGLYGPNEEVGRTRWPLQSRDATVFRSNVPPLEGSTLRLRVVDAAGQPVAVDAFRVSIDYDPPLADSGREYVEAAAGTGPHEFPLLVPAVSSRAIITPTLGGKDVASPLLVDSAFFHDRVNPFRAGGVDPILLEHIFVVGAAAKTFTAGEMKLVGSRRVTRVVFEYTYQVEVVNDGPAVPSLSASVTSADAHTSVVDGGLRYSNVPAYGRAFSDDTLTLRHDRRFPFDPTALRFTFGTAP